MASNSPAWPATPPKATAPTTRANKTGMGIPNNCLSMSFESGLPLNRFNSEIANVYLW